MKQPDYRNYSVEDLTRDDLFRRWVLNRNYQSERFWSDWLTENPDCTDKVQLARAFLQALEEKDTRLPVDELDAIFDGILEASRPSVIPFWQRTVFRVAASLLLLLSVGYLLFRNFGMLESARQTARVDESLREISAGLVENYTEEHNESTVFRTVVLQDSSTVVLYPKATLRYPKQFDATRREVYLSGQAFFSVTKNAKMPFWVYTDQISTQVLGTSFLVTAHAGNAKVEVRTGRVSVYMRKDVKKAAQGALKNEFDGVVLQPNQQAVFSNTEQRLLKSVVEQPIALRAPQKSDYVFDEAPIAQVFSLLEDTYGLTVLYDAATMKDCFLTANLGGESLFEKLDLICKITRSSYEMVDGQIVIHSKGCENK
ncbi:FecR family protein [Larkinella harenae]